VPSARADMSCSEFMRAYALQDAAALADARQIARPWIDASEESQVLIVGPAVGQQMAAWARHVFAADRIRLPSALGGHG